MAFSKEYLYPKDKQMTSAFCRALSHSARLEILEQLEKEGPLCVKELRKKHRLSKEAMSDHLRILRKAQLVECYEQYPYTFYQVNAKNMEKARYFIKKYLAIFKAHKYRNRRKGKPGTP